MRLFRRRKGIHIPNVFCHPMGVGVSIRAEDNKTVRLGRMLRTTIALAQLRYEMGEVDADNMDYLIYSRGVRLTLF